MVFEILCLALYLLGYIESYIVFTDNKMTDKRIDTLLLSLVWPFLVIIEVVSNIVSWSKGYPKESK